jgi:hypothetical protein
MPFSQTAPWINRVPVVRRLDIITVRVTTTNKGCYTILAGAGGVMLMRTFIRPGARMSFDEQVRQWLAHGVRHVYEA